MFNSYVTFFNQPQVHNTLLILYYTSFIWLPALLLVVLWDMWVMWRQALFYAKQTYVLLEVKLPREIFKSPQAAEFFISGLYSTLGEANWYDKYWKGSVRITHSLELVSIDGGVHFFIWTRSGARNQIEANLYSQFPGIEIFDVPDYTLPVAFNPETTSIYATEFDLLKPDSYPIKTYIDYGLDKDPKDEYKIDPLTPLVEALGSLGRGHQAWIQIILRAHTKEEKDPKTGEPADLRWQKGAKEEIDKILKESKGEVGADGKVVPGTGRFLTKGETETIAALERSVSKTGFDVGIRLMYIAPKDIFNMSNVGGLVGGIMHFNSNALNGFKPARGGPSPKYKFFLLNWKDRPLKSINLAKQELLDAYKRRAYFYAPYKRPHFVLNAEELATMFHFTSLVTMMTPTVERVGSKKAEAPSNLPQ